MRREAREDLVAHDEGARRWEMVFHPAAVVAQCERQILERTLGEAVGDPAGVEGLVACVTNRPVDNCTGRVLPRRHLARVPPGVGAAHVGEAALAVGDEGTLQVPLRIEGPVDAAALMRVDAQAQHEDAHGVGSPLLSHRGYRRSEL